MKILALAQYGSLVGGANRSFLMVLKNLKNSYHHEIKVLLPQKGALCDALDSYGIPWSVCDFHLIYGVSGKGARNALRIVKNDIFSLHDEFRAKRLAKQLQAEKYDLIYINDALSYMGGFLAGALHIPFVWHLRSVVQPKAHFAVGAERMFGKCARFITISKAMQEMVCQIPGVSAEQVAMVYNGIPIDDIPMSAQHRDYGLHICQCGRITPDKGQLDAIQAIGILKAKGIEDVVLHIVGAVPESGDSRYKNALEAAISELGVENQVVFEGPIDDMPAFRVNMNVELICSRNEPFGRVTVEGMRSGLAVIGSNTGGTKEIIEDGKTGLLYQCGVAESLAEKIEMVYADPRMAKKLIASAVEYAGTHYTEEGNVRQINEILLNSISVDRSK